jgi:hypothetical protein
MINRFVRAIVPIAGRTSSKPVSDRDCALVRRLLTPLRGRDRIGRRVNADCNDSVGFMTNGRPWTPQGSTSLR